MPDKTSFYAHGKLLITGEYFVLGGALALAAPTRYGQWLEVEAGAHSPDELVWTSLDAQGQEWFGARFQLRQGEWQLLAYSDENIGARLLALFASAIQQRPAALELLRGARVVSRLEFPRYWGLGSSSTLLANLASWLKVDAWALLASSFGGSGYDLACAQAEGPILYQIEQGIARTTPVVWQPAYAPHLHFVYLGQKQDSREGIQRYRQRLSHITHEYHELSGLTKALLQAQDVATAAELLARHEAIVSQALDLPLVQQRFPDFPGQLKSLGAWGGDFALVLSPEPAADLRRYFEPHGLHDLIPFHDMLH